MSPIQIDLSSSSPSKPKTPEPSGPVIGIDLGTTNSLVASVDRAGRAYVLRPANERALLPSVVALGDNGDVKSVGDAALALKATDAKRVLFSVKRLMGRSLADLESERAQIPFELEDDELHAQVRIRAAGRSISPLEVSAEILKALKRRAETELAAPVSRVVVTVPAYFDDAQRSATKAAGRLAGLDIIRVLNEPTAAALAYGWSNEHPGVVAVFDLGGGTFDVSILRIQENVFEVLATSGDTHLGGDDFDRALVDLVRPELSLKQADIGPLLVEAERLKVELSEKTEGFFNWRGRQVPVTRERVEVAFTPLVERALQLFEVALQDARLGIQQIDDVLLVGGSTRVPLVRQMLGRFNAGRAPNASLNPDEAVALGAALQAEILAGRGADRLLLDVVPLSLGIETMGGAVSKLIHRNSTIPAEAREIYTNHAEKQTAFDVHILQGERELVKDCRSLARFKLKGLAPAPAGFHRVEILFRIDANGILQVRARDLRSGAKHEVEVRPTFGLTDDELFSMLESADAKAEEDMDARQLVDARVEADTVVRATEKALVNAGGLLSTGDRSQVSARLVDLKNALRGPSHHAIRKAIGDLDEVSRDLAELQINAALKSALAGKSVDKA